MTSGKSPLGPAVWGRCICQAVCRGAQETAPTSLHTSIQQMYARVGPQTKQSLQGQVSSWAQVVASFFCGGDAGRTLGGEVGECGGEGALGSVGAQLSANEPLSAREGGFLQWTSLGGQLPSSHPWGTCPLTASSLGQQLGPRVIPGYGLPLESEGEPNQGKSREQCGCH